jgi:osmoprotectant transport system permease protein
VTLWAEELERLPILLGAHVRLTALALALGVLTALPLAIKVARAPRASFVALTLASAVQTIPSLALLALMVPLLGAFGFWPALVALWLYSMLPILRNGVTGIRGVDPDVREAALSLGMTRRQLLLRVELPLALPVIVAGIRTAAAWVVGIATLSTPVGQPSLGDFIFAGLQTRNWTSVIVGSVAAAFLALALDALLGGLEAGVTRRRPRRTAGALVGLAALFGAGLGAPLLARTLPSRTTSALKPAPAEPNPHAAAPAAPTSGAPVRVGSKTFTEQYILAGLIEQRLTAAGVAVERKDSLGSTIAFDALRAGDIDVYVEYTGTIWSNYMKRTAPESAWRTSAATAGWLAETHGIRQLGSLGFENAYALCMRRERALELGVKSVADLAPHAAELALGSDYEFFQRPEWASVRQAYGLQFSRLVTFDPSFMYSAVQKGDVDVITAFSSDGRIDAFDLVVLPDRKRALPPYDAVLLLSPRAAALPEVVEALRPLLDHVSPERMRHANLLVDREQDKATPRAAAEWLSQAIE